MGRIVRIFVQTWSLIVTLRAGCMQDSSFAVTERLLHSEINATHRAYSQAHNEASRKIRLVLKFSCSIAFAICMGLAVIQSWLPWSRRKGERRNMLQELAPITFSETPAVS